MDRQRFLIPMLALITVWRMALLPTTELCPDEALAVFYGQHLDWWHLEMGPLMPWLVKISTFIGGDQEIGVRWMAPLMSFAQSVMIWRLVRGIYDATTAAWTLVALQVLPVFNIASLSMTSSLVGSTMLIAYLMALRMALHRAHPWDRMWVIAGACLMAATLADWRNSLGWLCTFIALFGSRRRRHHIFSPGFAILTVAVLLPLIIFVRWNAMNHWPSIEAGEFEPIWQIWPNILRLLLLASPIVAILLVWSIRHAWQNRRRLSYDEALMLAFIIPFAAIDFAWGPRERWPQTGFPLWIAFGLCFLTQQSVALAFKVQQKIVLRSIAYLLAALQSMALMRSDFMRSLGFPWHLATNVVNKGKTYHRWFVADPASNLMGWQQSASVLGEIMATTVKPGDPPWFIIARHWPLAVELDHYLPDHVEVYQPAPEYPRVQVIESTERNQPLAMLPRYDATLNDESSFGGRNAIYISDDAVSNLPPPIIRKSFDRWEALTVVRIMHAGEQVRTIKIFACYRYKPLDL